MSALLDDIQFYLSTLGGALAPYPPSREFLRVAR